MTQTSKKDDDNKTRYFVLASAREVNYVSLVPNEMETNSTKKIKCTTKISVGLKDRLWHIMLVTMEHCHELILSISQLFLENKRMNLHVQRIIKINDEADR